MQACVYMPAMHEPAREAMQAMTQKLCTPVLPAFPTPC